jgi:hypothetical protein
MGARCTFVFKQSEDLAVALYSHWGEDSMYQDLAQALQHARPRWQDSSYGARMMISYLIKDSILDETGFGLYAVNGENYDLGEQTVVIDFTNNTVIDNVPVDWDKFVAAYSPLSV